MKIIQMAYLCCYSYKKMCYFVHAVELTKNLNLIQPKYKITLWVIFNMAAKMAVTLQIKKIKIKQ